MEAEKSQSAFCGLEAQEDQWYSSSPSSKAQEPEAQCPSAGADGCPSSSKRAKSSDILFCLVPRESG